MGNRDDTRIKIVPVEGLSADGRRSVFFLEMDDKFVNGKEKFEKIKSISNKNKLKRAMDMWIQNNNINSLHHGWDQNQHKGEFALLHVFKGNHHRLYGYKYHPSNAPNKEKCVIIFHYIKGGQDAPAAKMKKMAKIADLPKVQEALKKKFG
jgi:hypothetical protein